MRHHSIRASNVAALFLAAAPLHAGVMEFDHDKDLWTAVVGGITTVDFQGFPNGMIITDQYEEVGVIFTDGTDMIFFMGSFLNDGVGLKGNNDINVTFLTPRNWIAVDYPGCIRLELFSGGESIYLSGVFSAFDPSFAGLVSDQHFDAVRITDPCGIEAEIDDLFFGGLPPADLDGDGDVGINDFLALIAAWGPCPQPCPPACPADLDGDCAVGIGDFLMLLADWGFPPELPDCNANGDWDFAEIQAGASPDCNGNVVPDACDIAGGTSPDLNGDGIPDECQPPDNDDCDNALVITDGQTPFITFGATQDGPLAVGCGGGGINFQGDIWFLYTAPCTGTGTFSLCNDADFDTLLAVYYEGCPPPLNPLSCSNDAPGCGQTSEVSLIVVEGITYLVRVGGEEAAGVGVLTVSCEPLR